MTTITDITISWSEPIELGNNELWQAREGTVCISTTPNPGPKDGIAVKNGYVLPISAGMTVRYRKEGKGTPYVIREVN